MKVHRIDSGDPRYPTRAASLLDDDTPSVLHVIGDPQVLRQVQLGLICSVSCPGSVVIKTFDAIRELRDAGIVVAGGFHSPMERECLDFLLRGSQSVVLCPALGTEWLSLDPQQQGAVEDGRLVVIALFGPEVVRATPALAQRRNEFVAALADTVFVPHAVPGGKAEAAAMHAIARGQPVLTLEDDENRHLVALGARAVGLRDLARAARPNSVGQPIP